MKKLFVALSFLLTLNANAQNITFAGDGLSIVKIDNLTRGASLTVNPEDILTLSSTTDIWIKEGQTVSGINIHPNPFTDKSTIDIFPPVSGDAVITIYEISGKSLFMLNVFLENSGQRFTISGTGEGLYLISVKAASYQFSGKLISRGKSNGQVVIEKQGGEVSVAPAKKPANDYKGVQEDASILYSAGDILKFTGTSGNNTTIITTGNIKSDTTITFTFTACTDADGNNYPVVMIGSRLWMAKNLKTTKYSDNTTIPLVTSDISWGTLTTPGYCFYLNDESAFKDPYGALYNAYAVEAGNVCPAGWHVPTDTEWSAMTTFLGGEIVAGGKLKETGTSHWTTPNLDATDEAGFSALPGGARTLTGSFDFLGGDGHWWSSSEENSEFWIRYISNGYGGVARISADKEYGLSIRCIKDYIIESESDINDTLNLCYSLLGKYIEYSYLFDAVYSNKVLSPNSSWNEIFDHSQTPNSLKISKLWYDAYEIIFKANLIITSAPQVITDQQTRDRVIGQAKSIRAYLYHNLLIWFGELPLETGYAESLIPRNTVEEVLAFIKQDASEAVQTLPLNWTAPDNFRINRSFAGGLLGRAGLFDGSYAQALDPSMEIINSSMYALSADTLNFTSSNSEIYWGFNKGTDPVFNTFFNKGVYVPVIRYSETFLVSAECNFNTGNQSLALNLINMLIARRGGTPITVNDLTNDVIYSYWRKDMSKEGNMFITMKRFDKALAVVQGMTHKLLLPVPMEIIIANPWMTQNPGY
jgi:uncharacterized protein (TIGR02145 family)